VASQGPLSPSTLTDDASNGGTIPWDTPGNAAASDDVRTVADNPTGSAFLTHRLVATGFPFSVPTGATINGILVEWEQLATGTVLDAAVRVVKGGTVGSTDRSAATNWPTSEAYVTYGSSSDLWGDTWTDSDVNASDFGAAISATVSAASAAKIDHVRITVYYTVAGWSASQWAQAVVGRPQPAPPRSLSRAALVTEPTNWTTFDVGTFPRCGVGRGGPPRPAMRSLVVGFAEPLSYATFDAATVARSTTARPPRDFARPGRQTVFTPPIVEPTIAAPLDPGTVPPSVVVTRQVPPVQKGSWLVTYGKMVDSDVGEQEQPQIWVGRARVESWPASRTRIALPPPQPETPAGFDAWAARFYPGGRGRTRAGRGRSWLTPELSGPPMADARVSRGRRATRRAASWLTDPVEPTFPWPSRWTPTVARTVRPVPLARTRIATVHPTLAETPAAVFASAPRRAQARGRARAVWLADFLTDGLGLGPVVVATVGRRRPRRPAPSPTATFEPLTVGGVAILRPLVARPLFWRTRAWWPRTLLAWCPQTVSTAVRKDDRDGAGGGGNSRSVTGYVQRGRAGTGNPSQ
jgi:hypothetical protein